jgi:hypothetical protein
MKKKLQIVLMFSMLVFSACRGPLNKTYNPRTFEEDMQSMRESKINEDDIQLLAKFILVSKLAGNDLNGETYASILEKVKSIQKAGNDIAERERNVVAGRSQRLKPLLEVNLISKNFIRIKDRDYLSYKVVFHNLSHTDIKTVIGSIGVNDLMDKQIKKVNILLDEQLKANSTFEKTYTFEYNHSDEQDKRIRSKDLIDMRIAWIPEKIIFEDGRLAE